MLRQVDVQMLSAEKSLFHLYVWAVFIFFMKWFWCFLLFCILRHRVRGNLALPESCSVSIFLYRIYCKLGWHLRAWFIYFLNKLLWLCNGLRLVLCVSAGNEQPSVHLGECGHTRASLSKCQVYSSGGSLLPTCLQHQLQGEYTSSDWCCCIQDKLYLSIWTVTLTFLSLKEENDYCIKLPCLSFNLSRFV